MYTLQPTFAFDDAPITALEKGGQNEKAYALAFRKLYYHLYSNSRASRAERIITDICNLLLCKIACERNGGKHQLERFVQGHGSANELLLPILLESFPHLVSQSEQFSIEDEALRYGLSEIASLSFGSAPAHILGEAFQALIGPRLRGDKGQFFTPRNLVKAIVEINNPPPDAKVVDPASGTGGFLVETHIYQAKKYGSEALLSGPLIGLDKDTDLCRLTTAALEITAPHRYAVINGNSLNFHALRQNPANTAPVNADFVFTNPPFGANIKITDHSILRQFALGHKWVQDSSKWRQEATVRTAQDPQLLFLELCIKLLKPGGQLAIILPEGVFGNSGLGYVWDYVRAQGEITALLDCPRTTFQPSTDTKTNVLFFKKRGGPEYVSAKHVLTAVALHCGHDRRGRTIKSTGEPYPDDFQLLGSSFNNPQERPFYWQESQITEPYYLIPRYYEVSPVCNLVKKSQPLRAEEMVTLGEMVTSGFLNIRKGHEVGSEAYGTGGVPFVRTSDIANYEVSFDPTRGVNVELYEQYASQQQLAPDDILLVADGRYRIGRTAILHEHNYRCIVQSHIRIISVSRTSPINAIELLYLLNLPSVQRQVRNMVFIQSTLGSLGKRLYKIQIPLPQESGQWRGTIEKFSKLIAERASLLQQLKEFEPQAYEL